MMKSVLSTKAYNLLSLETIAKNDKESNIATKSFHRRQLTFPTSFLHKQNKTLIYSF